MKTQDFLGFFRLMTAELPDSDEFLNLRFPCNSAQCGSVLLRVGDSLFVKPFSLRISGEQRT